MCAHRPLSSRDQAECLARLVLPSRLLQQLRARGAKLSHLLRPQADDALRTVAYLARQLQGQPQSIRGRRGYLEVLLLAPDG